MFSGYPENPTIITPALQETLRLHLALLLGHLT